MNTLYFHVEERRSWVRTGTHTVVHDRDPDYPRFERDPSGDIRSRLRIWLAESRGDKLHLCAYLGTVHLCFRQSSYRDILRLFRFTTKAAQSAGQSASLLRRKLAMLIREQFQHAYHQKQLRRKAGK